MDNYSFKQEHVGRVEYRDSDGRLHRIDGPAIEWSNGSKSWWINGKRHRTDGPAVEWSDGNKEWFIYDIELTEEEFNKYMNSIFGIL